MPTSNHRNISKIIDIVIKLEPKKVLDIGSGFGKFGVLCREYLELWDSDEYLNWTRTIDTIEIYSDYINPIHKFIYNNIYIGDASEIVRTLPKYDLILVIDVLEHFEKERGKIFIEECLHVSKSLLISLPQYPSEQHEVFGNKSESHISKWTKEELKRMGCTCFLRSDDHFIVLISNEKTIRTIKNAVLREKFRFLLKYQQYIPFSSLAIKWIRK